MKNKLLYILIISMLASCSTYNYQSNNAEMAIYELKSESKKALFSERKFTKGSHTLKFYIHDLDDSTFQFKNVQIYDSTLAGELEAVQNDIVKDSLYMKNIDSKNEIHIDINRQCTNKNSKIYLESNDILKLQSYNLIQQKTVSKKTKTFLMVYFGILILGAIAMVILLNSFFNSF